MLKIITKILKYAKEQKRLHNKEYADLRLELRDLNRQGLFKTKQYPSGNIPPGYNNL